jgi:uncharacterized protein (DUF302 family)
MVGESTSQSVIYGTEGKAVATFQRSRTVAVPLQRMVDRFRAEIAAEDLLVLHEIDPQAILARSGFDIGPARQILFFHPKFMARLLAADPSALLEAPLKFALIERADRVTVTIRWMEPAASFGRYGSPELQELGEELSMICERIVSRAAAD